MFTKVAALTAKVRRRTAKSVKLRLQVAQLKRLVADKTLEAWIARVSCPSVNFP
jgi:hypothetical protein